MIETVDGGRRRLLVALAGVPLLGGSLLACTTDPLPKAAPGPRLDLDVKVRWTAVRGEQALLALHAAVTAAHPALADRLAPLTAHHSEHLAALTADGPLPYGGRPPDDDPTAPLGDVPGDPAAALTVVRDAERAASELRVTDCLRAAGPGLAAVLASIAASEAAHGTVLESA